MPSELPEFDELTYFELNSDVETAVLTGAVPTGYDHWIRHGKAEGRLAERPPLPIGAPSNWDEAAYLRANPDVAAAIRNGGLGSGYQHWTSCGHEEGRLGGPASRESLSNPREVLAAVPMGFNCFGYETAPTGLGSAARGYADALRTLTANVSRTDVPVWGVETPPVVPEERSTSNPFACNLILQNPDVLALFLQHYGLATLKNRINIAGWVWELHSGYPEWSRLTRLFHEIWVPSTFVADALRPISTVPVAVVPYPVDRLPETRVLTRASLGLPETALIFLYVFDLGSTTGRKNPLALLRAFRDAFGARADVRLVLKYHNTENDPAGAATLERLASGLPNVHLISHTMATDEVYGLIQLADCFVSPHRSEGFGLNIATAMYYGKPVIVTGYSGNMDFTTPQTAFLIDYDVVAVGQGHPHYRPNYGWAEPSPAHLQALLLRVFEHPDFAQRVGAAGQHIIRSRFSMEAVASSIRERLQAITSRSL